MLLLPFAILPALRGIPRSPGSFGRATFHARAPGAGKFALACGFG
ncbi:MAG: hypothetical protein ACRD41_03575 [Candidatus Acidiferrales bacterium]